MTREQAIERWTDIAGTIFWAEERISDVWKYKLKAMVDRPKEERVAFIQEYCRAIAIEITNATSDEELAAIE